MQVWRIHLNNGVKPPKTKNDLIQFCFTRHVIGVGWDAITTHGDEASIREQAKQAYDSKYLPGFKAVNAMRKMKVGDLIWTYAKESKTYYLCRVKNTWANRVRFPEQDGLDIGNYVSVDWVSIGTVGVIPGAVFNSFSYNSSVQRISNVENISKAYWNHYSQHTHYHDVQNLQPSEIWNVLTPECVEEVVLLYLQFVKRLVVMSGALKQTTPVYECVMVDKDGNRHYPQVKSGKFALNAQDYLSTVQSDPRAHVYLFATSQEYGQKPSNDHIHCLSKDEIEEFMRDYWKALPAQTKIWLELCEFPHK